MTANRNPSLSPEAFDGLLGMLDPDRELAAEAYTRLRDRIAGLLQWWGGVDADGLADETLDRVARKLQEGAVIGKGSLGAYARGVARMVFYESTRRERPQPIGESDHDRADPGSVNDGDRERDLKRLDQCLERLDAPDRALVLRYYEDGRKAEVRSRLASDLGISATALRIRAHRLRARLERCVQSHVAGEEKA